jgi:hypothetical protein
MSTLPQLPPEIWNIIMEMKEILEFPVPGRYIIKKKIDPSLSINPYSDNEIKEQIVTIDDRFRNYTGELMYGYYYGVVGFHEGYCNVSEIRYLTDIEKDKDSDHQYWELPQQFYQSMPSF